MADTGVAYSSIGSNMAFELITMGFTKYVLYDDDVVEPRNLASQKAYRHRDLYMSKVEALAAVLIEHGATEVLVRNRRLIETDVIDTALVIGGVDSMKSRHIIWEVIKNSPDVELYLDGRLDGLVAQVFAVEALDSDWYEKQWLFSDDAAAKGGDCTMRTIVFPATIMSAIMCRHVSNWYLGLPICRFTMADMANLELVKVGDIEE